MEISVTEKKSNTFSGEDVVVIDPCYVINWSVGLDSEWQEVCSKIDEAGTIIIDNMEALYTQTKHGDGCYPVRARGQEAGRAAVDSGLLSVWRVKDALRINPGLDLELGAVIPGIMGPVFVDGDEGRIGGVVICHTEEEW